MGKPYADEMDAMRGTYEWAMSSDVAPLAGFAAAAAGSPLYAVGIGGSLTAATLAAALHHDTGSAAEALTPLAFLDRERLDCSAASVLLFTAGGANVDMLAALDRAVALRPAALCLVSTSPRSRAARAASRARGARLQADRAPTGRDGFLATNSLLAMSVWACRAYGEAGLSCCGGLPGFGSLAGEAAGRGAARAAALRGCSSLAVLHDAWGKIAAVDIESKMVEGGMVGVQAADYRNFAHGRYNWLDKRPGSGVVCLVSPGCERLASDTMEAVPDKVPSTRIKTHLDGPAGSLALLVEAMRLVGAFGRGMGVDPGRPGVAAYGRRLYWLRYRPPPLGNATAAERAALCRRFGTDREAGPGARRLGDLRRFVDRLGRQKFGGIVLGYDGTLAGARGPQRAAGAEAKRILNALLSSGIAVCVCTRQGRAAGTALRRSIPKEYWDRTLVGYFNGAEVGPLGDAGVPDESGPVDPALAEFLSVRALEGALAGAARTVLPRQVTYEGGGLSAADLAERLAAADPAAAKRVKILGSAGPVDVVAATASGPALVRRARHAVGAGLRVLCMGCEGRRPGRDHELLSHPYSLSVCEASGDGRTCWNLLPPGIRGVAGTVHYMQRFKVCNGHFRVGELR